MDSQREFFVCSEIISDAANRWNFSRIIFSPLFVRFWFVSPILMTKDLISRIYQIYLFITSRFLDDTSELPNKSQGDLIKFQIY